MEDVDSSAETTTVTKPVPLRVSDAALISVMDILNAEDEPDALGLRVAVTGTRGVEYAYDLSFEERSEAADDDVIYNQGDLVVMIPAWSSNLGLRLVKSPKVLLNDTGLLCSVLGLDEIILLITIFVPFLIRKIVCVACMNIVR